MTLVIKTLSELEVGDVIVDIQGKQHTLIEPLRAIEEDGSGFYPEIKGKVSGFSLLVKHRWMDREFVEERRIFPATLSEPPIFKVEVK